MNEADKEMYAAKALVKSGGASSVRTPAPRSEDHRCRCPPSNCLAHPHELPRNLSFIELNPFECSNLTTDR